MHLYLLLFYMNISDRVKKFFASKGLDYKGLAEKAGITEPAAENYLMKDRTPNTQIMQKFGEAFPELDLHWLLTGHGHMLREATLNEAKNREIPINDEITYIPSLINKLQSSAAIRDRVQQIIYTYNIDLEVLAGKTNITEPVIRSQIYAKKPIAIDVIRGITHLVPEISYQWILTGNVTDQDATSLSNRLLNDLKERTNELIEKTEKLVRIEEINAKLEEQLHTKKK